MNNDKLTSNIEYLNSPITSLKGIGPKKAALFAKLGLRKVWDLVYDFPANYEDRRIVKKLSECIPGELCCIKVRPVRQIVERRIKNKLSLFLLYASDGYEDVTVKWFSAPYTKPKIYAGHIYTIYGSLSGDKGRKEFDMRYLEDSQQPRYTEKIVPVYHATAGLTSKTISEAIYQAFDSLSGLDDCLPYAIRERYGLAELYESVKFMHYPPDMETLRNARERLAFEEMFVLCLALSAVKERRQQKDGVVLNCSPHIRQYAAGLPFELTDGQKETINRICADIKSGKPMNRLVQGDVGCGKTAVAAAAIYGVVKNGYQAAFMAPTEILANQHSVTLRKLLGDDVRIALVTSSAKGKKQLLADVAAGKYDVVIGTHALIQEDVYFPNLALCVTDEQHRFGVNQRALLSSKGKTPHILVMSATPIPRTLSLILYGDLDISVIKTKPVGRRSIDTFHIDSSKRSRAYNFVRNEVEAGHQCYVVCPLVEESETVNALSVETILESLQSGVLKDLRVECVHGKMKSDAKESVMNRFKDGEIDVLVSTTVIEVGVDVPNATVMLIENAERFGLSQLHQLRGRVGRGEHKSYCILVSDGKTDNCRERMKIMTESADGFVISQKDLELRGSGQFFGTRQHGVPELKIANLFSDSHILAEAVEAAGQITESDPSLSAPELANIRGRIQAIFDEFEGNDIFN